MPLSKAITGHHTVWVAHAQKQSVALRYTTVGDELVCFGDGELASIEPGEEVVATVHEIASGPPIESFRASVRVVAGAELSLSDVAAIHGNAPDPVPGANPFELLRSNRRFLGLSPLTSENADDQHTEG